MEEEIKELELGENDSEKIIFLLESSCTLPGKRFLFFSFIKRKKKQKEEVPFIQ